MVLNTDGTNLSLELTLRKFLKLDSAGYQLEQAIYALSFLKYNSDGGGTGPRLADRMHIVLHADHIIEVHSHGVRVLD